MMNCLIKINIEKTFTKESIKDIIDFLKKYFKNN